MLNISETVQDIDTVTMKYYYRLMTYSRVSFRMTLSDPEWLQPDIIKPTIATTDIQEAAVAELATS